MTRKSLITCNIFCDRIKISGDIRYLGHLDLKTKEIKFMPCPFTGPKMFCAGPNILCQPKNLSAFSASSRTFVLAQ